MAPWLKFASRLSLTLALCAPGLAARGSLPLSANVIDTGTGEVYPDNPESSDHVISGEVRLLNPESLRYPIWESLEELEVEFLDPRFRELRRNYDYYLDIASSTPGQTQLYIYGYGDYSGRIVIDVEILKGVVTPDKYNVVFPSETTCDGSQHLPSFRTDGYIPYPEISFIRSDDQTGKKLNQATLPGTYRVYLDWGENDYYETLTDVYAGDMTVYAVAEEQISTLEALLPDLQKGGFKEFCWNDYYESYDARRYLGILGFNNGNISSITLSEAFHPEAGSGYFPYSLLEINGVERLNLNGNDFDCDMAAVARIIKTNPIWSNNAAQLKYLTLNHNHLSGDAGAFSVAFPNLEGLEFGYNHFSDCSLPPISGSNRYLFYPFQTIDRSLTIDMTRFDAEALLKSIPTIALYDPYSNGVTDLLTATIYTGDTIYNDFAMSIDFSIYNGSLQLSDPYSGGSGEYRGPLNNTFSIALSMGNWFNAPSQGVFLKANVTFLPRDVNFDFHVNVADIQYMAGYILSPYNVNLINITQADMNEDERLDVRDIVLFTDLLLSMAPASFTDAAGTRRLVAKRSPYAGTKDAEESPAYARIITEDGNLYLECEGEVAAIDILVDGPEAPQWSAALIEAGLSVTTRSNDASHRMIAYSPTGASLAAGRHLIASGLTGNPRGGSAADSNGRSIPLVSDVTTSVESPTLSPIRASRCNEGFCLDLPEEAEWSLFSMSGIKIASGQAPQGRSIISAESAGNSPAILTVRGQSSQCTFKL